MTHLTKASRQSGFQSLLKQRAVMQNWSHLRTILTHASNREATAIVRSFESYLCVQEDQFETRSLRKLAN